MAGGSSRETRCLHGHTIQFHVVNLDVSCMVETKKRGGNLPFALPQVGSTLAGSSFSMNPVMGNILDEA